MWVLGCNIWYGWTEEPWDYFYLTYKKHFHRHIPVKRLEDRVVGLVAEHHFIQSNGIAFGIILEARQPSLHFADGQPDQHVHLCHVSMPYYYGKLVL